MQSVRSIMLSSRIAPALCAFCAAGCIAAASVSAQSYPNKPIRLIVPWPAGGGADVIGRTLAVRLGDALGQQIIVDNRAGAAGIIGTEAAARSAPDGYTIYQGNTATLGINPALHARLPYDAVSDFAPISLINTGTLIVVVHPSLPAKNVRELIALAKTQPGRINYASAGPGSPAHLVAEMFKSEANVNFTHIPYKGAAPAAIDLIAGQVDLMFGDFITCFPHVKSGKLRALAVTAGKRSPMVPDIPTVREAGGPDLQAVSWSAILAPAGTPAAIVQRLHSEIVKIAASADFNEKMRANGGTPVTSTPAELAAYIRAEIARYTRAVKDSGTKIE